MSKETDKRCYAPKHYPPPHVTLSGYSFQELSPHSEILIWTKVAISFSNLQKILWERGFQVMAMDGKHLWQKIDCICMSLTQYTTSFSIVDSHNKLIL